MPTLIRQLPSRAVRRDGRRKVRFDWLNFRVAPCVRPVDDTAHRAWPAPSLTATYTRSGAARASRVRAVAGGGGGRRSGAGRAESRRRRAGVRGARQSLRAAGALALLRL